MMQLGCDGVFVGSGIFKSSNPEILAKAIVDATTFFNDHAKLAEISTGMGKMMVGETVSVAALLVWSIVPLIYFHFFSRLESRH